MNILKKISASTFVILCGGLISSFAHASPFVYIANPQATQNFMIALDPSHGEPQYIKRVDKLNDYPGYICISPDNLRAYVVTSGKIAIVDTLTSTQIDSIELRKDFTRYIRQLAISPDGKTLYVIGLNYDTALLASVDIASHKIINKLVLPDFQTSPNHTAIPEAFAATPDGKKGIVLLKSRSNESAIAFVDLTTQKISQVTKLAGVGHRLVITSDGKKAYIPIHDGSYSTEEEDTEEYDIQHSGDSIRSLLVFDLSTNTLKTTLPISGTGDITLSSNGKKAYLLATDKINIIDTKNDSVIGNVPIPGNAHHRIAITPDEKYSYVTDYNEDGGGGGLLMFTDLQSQETVRIGGYSTGYAEAIVFLNPKAPHSIKAP